MVWRLSRAPCRPRPRRLQSTYPTVSEALGQYRLESTHVARIGHARRQPKPRDPKRGPPHVKHARLLGDGNSYKTEQLEGTVKVTGLVRSIRKQKVAAFAHVADGTTLAPIQAVLSPELAKNITNGAYVELLGKWQESQGQGQAHELQVENVQSIGESNSEDNPIQKQAQTPDFLRHIPHLRIRTPLQSLIARTRSHLIYSASNFFNYGRRQTVYQVQPPLITSSDCEGAGEVFTLSPRSTVPTPGAVEGTKEQKELYFKEPKYLTVSSQLHLEAYSAELGDVWALSPTFRAEESDTPRHLAEFYMLEAEFRGQTRLEGVTGRVKQLVHHLVKGLREDRTGKELLEYYANKKNQPAEPVELEQRWASLEGEWKTITYTQAIEELQKAFSTTKKLFKFQPSWDTGLQLEHEKWVVENMGEGKPVFVTDYPKKTKPFYMLPSSLAAGQGGDPAKLTVSCFDLLLPYGYCEVVGGSLREHRLEQIITNMREKGLLKKSSNPESEYPYLQPGESLGNLQWYADLRRYGSSPHGGFGLGWDRLLAYLAGVSNVRDTVGFPRAWGRADC